MEKLEKLDEYDSKRIFATDDPDTLLISFKDETTAFGGLKRGRINGKGIVNNRINNYVMQLLEKQGVPTCFREELNERETLVKRVELIPLEIIVRNKAAGDLSQRLELPEGTVLSRPVVELCYKSEELNDPLVNRYHILAMNWATKDELDRMEDYAQRINTLLLGLFSTIGIELIDFKLEFGRDRDGTLVLADEISPDTCRLWDASTHEKLDKDRFRRDMDGIEEAYQEIWRRLTGE